MLICKVCGAANESEALFCAQCTSPLTVVSLSDLNETDRSECFAALWKVLAECTTQANETGDTGSQELQHDADLLRRYLSAFWLRPETAMIAYAEAQGLRALSHLTPEPWLDLGCGDGIHASIYRGYELAPEFDAFQSLDLSLPDIYNHFDPARFQPRFVREGQSMRYGVDLKDTAVQRAEAMGVFDEVVKAPAEDLPIADGQVGTIFSNMIRDRGDSIGDALAECSRVLVPGGALVFSAMTPAYADNLYFAPRAKEAVERNDTAWAKQMLRLDRGRSVFCRQQLPLSRWEELLAEHGFKVAAVQPILGGQAIRFWDVGFRPFSTEIVTAVEQWRAAGVIGAVKPPLLSALERMIAPVIKVMNQGPTFTMQLIAAVRV